MRSGESVREVLSECSATAPSTESLDPSAFAADSRRASLRLFFVPCCLLPSIGFLLLLRNNCSPRLKPPAHVADRAAAMLVHRLRVASLAPRRETACQILFEHEHNVFA